MAALFCPAWCNPERQLIVEEAVTGISGSIKMNAIRLTAFSALALLTMLALAGCQIGPVNLGGGTPVPTVPPTNTVPPPTPTTPPRPLAGHVLDTVTGKPIANADVTAGGVLTETTTDGAFYFDDVPLGSKVTIAADGYAKIEADPGSGKQFDAKLRPNSLSGQVTDKTTGQPLAGVLVKLVLPQSPVTPTTNITGTAPIAATAVATPTATTQSTGMLGFGNVLAAPLAASTQAAGDSSTAAGDGSTPTDAPPSATPAPPTPTALPPLVPPTGPGFVSVYTDASGNYFFKNVPQGASLTFKMPGYKLTKLPVDETGKKDVALDQFKVEGIYITANVAASPDLLNELLDFIPKSRINTVVLNVQDDASAWVFDVKNPDVIAAKNTDEFLKEMPDLVKRLKGMGLYTIARVVTFQQKTMAEARPDWAVKSSTTGKPWKGGYTAAQRWLDASNPAAQDYMVDMTKEVIGLGFDEVQYDYIRFPSDPAPSETGDMVFAGGTLTDTGKELALQQFFKKAYAVIEPSDAFMSADVFGYSLWPDQDGKPILGVIGQVPSYLLPYTDYLSPMIYPSHFSAGEQNCAKPATCAYTLVRKSGEYAADIFKGYRAKYRPWLEDFDWPGADYTSPGTTKVADQIRAAKETNAWGWLWWDASNQYEPRASFLK